ncbi:DUF5655 domain-containing protein [Litoribacter populi]|uniref:DUF5655 domain-containing protein n=1 Tax=Litoribacter populi TaxID=2598460 RepID=UPI001F47B67C|nr:DUF5655 domain-containing protein [Litoribacter populi]
MIDNLYNNTGKTLEEWVEIVNKEDLPKHGEKIKFLKEQHDFTHGFANLVAQKAKETETGPQSTDDLFTSQYQGKEHFLPLYERLMKEVQSFGADIEISPKKAYMSLKRTKQFATLKPATKTRFEIGVNLKGVEPSGKLEAEKPNSMCTHKISLSGIEDIDGQVISWIKASYENAG